MSPKFLKQGVAYLALGPHSHTSPSLGNLHNLMPVPPTPEVLRPFLLVGLSAREALTCGTIGGARNLGRNDIGRIAPGKRRGLTNHLPLYVQLACFQECTALRLSTTADLACADQALLWMLCSGAAGFKLLSRPSRFVFCGLMLVHTQQIVMGCGPHAPLHIEAAVFCGLHAPAHTTSCDVLWASCSDTCHRL